jgi:ankyrin repeat protein
MRHYRTADEVLDVVWHVVEFGSFKDRPTVNSVGIFGSQPLKTVVTWDDLNAVGLLLDAGADINAHHEDGDTALHHAIRMGHFNVARLLIHRGADQSRRNHEGKLARDYCSNDEWHGLGLTS